MLNYSIPKALKSFEKDARKRYKLMKDNGIPENIANQYNLAVHARDIFKNEADKVARHSEIMESLERIEANYLASDDPGMRATLEREEQKLLKELDTLKPYEIHRFATEEWADHIIRQFENVPGMKEQQQMFIQEQRKNIAMLKEAGVITDAAEEAMMKAHPNYVPLNREVTDEYVKRSASARNPIRERSGGSQDLDIIDLNESALKNRIAAVQAVDRADLFNTIDRMSKISDLSDVFQRISPSDPNFERMSMSGQLVKGYGDMYYKVPPVLKEAIEQSPESASKIVDALSKSAQLFKNMTTSWNPRFHIRSLARDTPQMMATSNTQAHIGHMMMGFLDSFAGKPLSKLGFTSYKDVYESLGGEHATFISQDQNSIKRYLKAVKNGKYGGMQVFNPLRQMENFGNRIEQVARLGEFRSAKGKGYSDEDAFFEAINLLDYKDQGSLTQKVNKVAPYFSPTMRGNIRTVQAMKNPQFWAVGSAMVSVPTIANYIHRFSDGVSDLQRDKINNLPTWAKNTMWAFPVPNSEDDKVILYPKPFILGQLMANPIERTLDKIFVDTEKPTKEILAESGLDLFSTTVPTVSIVGLTGINQVQANQRFFTGMPIEDSKMQQNPDKEERFNVYTSEVAKGLGQMTGQSPAVIDSLIKGQFGTLGQQGLDVMDNIIAKDGSRPSKIQTNAEILNPLGSFVYKDTSSSGLYDRIRTQSLRDDKEQKSKLGEGERRKKGYERTEAQSIFEFLKDTNKEIAEIRESTEKTSKEKSEEISRIRNEQKQKAAEIMKPR